MLQSFTDDAMATMDNLRSVAGLQFIVSFQAFGPKVTSASGSLNNDNFLGLDENVGDIVLACLTVSWTDENDDETMNRAIQKLIERGNMKATELGVDNDYIFMIYAAP